MYNVISKSYEANEALEKGLFVSLTAGKVEAADATAEVIGVTLNSCDSGDFVEVAVAGECDVQASAALTDDGIIGPDANGRAQDHAAGASKAALVLESGVAASGGEYSFVRCVLLDMASREALTTSLTAGAEAANVIEVTVQAAPGAAVTYYAEVIDDADGLPVAATEFHIGATTGTEISTTDKAGLLFTTTAAGAAVLEVTDVVGGAGQDVHLKLSPLGAAGEIAYITLTFD